MLFGLGTCGGIAPTSGVPMLCFIHSLAYPLRCIEGVLAVFKQGWRASLFAYMMGSDPQSICFHELNIHIKRKCGFDWRLGWEVGNGGMEGTLLSALSLGLGEEALATLRGRAVRQSWRSHFHEVVWEGWTRRGLFQEPGGRVWFWGDVPSGDDWVLQCLGGLDVRRLRREHPEQESGILKQSLTINEEAQVRGHERTWLTDPRKKRRLLRSSSHVANFSCY